MRDLTDNAVYVVSVSAKPILEGNPYSWIDVIEQDRTYFHPMDNKWPVVPPNYMGFRYAGKLQSVHHIDDYQVITNLADHNGRWPTTDRDHFVYALGPAMQASGAVKNGKIYPSGRLWCAIDTLLSGACSTIADARDETKRRREGTRLPQQPEQSSPPTT